MPSGVYIRTEECNKAHRVKKRKVGCGLYPHKLWSNEQREKITSKTIERVKNGTHNFITNPKIGPQHHNWKGNCVSYGALHCWVKRNLGHLKECVYCGIRDVKIKNGKPAIQMANVSHQYKRELTDWIPLCIPCHTKYDVEYRADLI